MQNKDFKMPTKNFVVMAYPSLPELQDGEEAPELKLSDVTTVVAIGPDCEKDSDGNYYLTPGDEVVLHPTTQLIDVEVNGTMYIIVNEYQICLIK